MTPAEFRPSIYAIDLTRLQQRGIRALIVDLDNTLVPWADPNPTAELQSWLKRVRASGLGVCIVSNARTRRVTAFAEKLGVPCIPAAIKPFRRGFRAALACLGTCATETAVVGDQVFTDVLGGNRLGLYTILVQPVSNHEFFGTRLVRLAERIVLGWLGRRSPER